MIFHHQGWLVNDIDIWEKNVLFETKINQIFDPVQQATLALYKNFDGGYIELISPANDTAFTWAELQKKGPHFHHNCYQIDTVEQMQVVAKQNKLLLFKGPLKAILFNNNEVFFYINRNRQIIEFLIHESPRL